MSKLPPLLVGPHSKDRSARWAVLPVGRTSDRHRAGARNQPRQPDLPRPSASPAAVNSARNSRPASTLARMADDAATPSGAVLITDSILLALTNRRWGNGLTYIGTEGSAKPAPTTLTGIARTARETPPPITRAQAARTPRSARSARSIGALGAPFRPASRGSAKPAPTTQTASPRSARNSPRYSPHSKDRSAGQFSRWGPPTGIARERETSPDNPDRHRPRSARNSPRYSPHSKDPQERWAVLPVGPSDRHRAGARNQPRQP